ncbi:hypothetical protein K8352_09230 [Flavobacteriaceae bacterium F89]|uniref:Tetratricopeptide repeat protein n=1 Tax=Cerina litoralis TaxID=2874477 RepID=A0AAE3EUV7_9FLAO|nr:hypothetical protein [Cerina litoralis]MCG2460930.1 hypothetical protein [Cerina litoralis]
MKNTGPLFFLFILGLLLKPNHALTQEPEEGNAAVSTEMYSDEFQEAFFEALKQKAIENYDKAIILLLKCKEISPNNEVVDFELAKAYSDGGNFVLAQEYAVNALNSKPENLWYLNVLAEILPKLGNSFEGIKTRIPFDNIQLRENLALIYYWHGNYEGALKVLKGIKISSFTANLVLKIKDSIAVKQNPATVSSVGQREGSSKGPLQSYYSQIEQLIVLKDYEALIQIASNALESFPTQPYFYYAYGVALNNNSQYKKASETLESALDYLLDDTELNNKIYRQLSNAYSALGNSSKANMYLSKIKPGS